MNNHSKICRCFFCITAKKNWIEDSSEEVRDFITEYFMLHKKDMLNDYVETKERSEQ